MKINKLLLLLLSCFSGSIVFAQNNALIETVPMADDLRQSGKIYIVVIVIALVFTGIVFYLIRLDRKMAKLEKETRDIDSLNS